MAQQQGGEPQRIAEATIYYEDGTTEKFTNVLYKIDATPAMVFLQFMQAGDDKLATVIPLTRAVRKFELVPPKVDIASAGDLPPDPPEKK